MPVYQHTTPLPVSLTIDVDTTIDDYLVTSLPFKMPTTFIPPFTIANYLKDHRNVITDNGLVITKCKLIKHVVKHKLVPIKISSMYKLIHNATYGQIPIDATWTEIVQDGKKAYLSSRELNVLIQEIRDKSRGGVSFSMSELRDEVENRIRYVYTSKKKLHLLPIDIPEHTLNVYVSIIKSQSIFNLYKSVGNKTESRHVAEWSIRSTIAYTMVVAVNHFIPGIVATKYHPKKRDLSPKSLLMWSKVEKAYNKMIGSKENIELHPVLPNLVTSTDEMTIFATSSKINSKESLYITARPDEIKNELCSSGYRNHYKKKLSGDSHCRGVRIVINSTFTAGGLSAPLFVTVYGLTKTEMPGSDFVSIPVPGLAVGGHQDLYSKGVGSITFVRSGRDEKNEQREEVIPAVGEHPYKDTTATMPDNCSKESQIANLYRKSVFWPFIEEIRKTCYGFSGSNDDIPEELKCVSWFDGCNSQMKILTSEQNMKIEASKKITCCKHSASRTAVEQAADTGPMFKELKRVIRETDNPTAANSYVFSNLQQSISELEKVTITDPSSLSSTACLKLLLHKKRQYSTHWQNFQSQLQDHTLMK